MYSQTRKAVPTNEEVTQIPERKSDKAFGVRFFLTDKDRKAQHKQYGSKGSSGRRRSKDRKIKGYDLRESRSKIRSHMKRSCKQREQRDEA